MVKEHKYFVSTSPDYNGGKDGRVFVREVWRRDSDIHCWHRPAIAVVDPLTGQSVHEEWYLFGVLDRRGDDLPAVISEKPRLPTKTQEWWFRGRRHRENAPAKLVEHKETGVIVEEEWWQKNKRHRTDGPALTNRTVDGKIVEEKWYIDGQLHRPDGPASWALDRKTGLSLREEWRLHDKKHRTDGPALIKRHSKGHIIQEEWRNNGRFHRVDGPAKRLVSTTGLEYETSWYWKGLLHRTDGPALVRKDRQTGDVIEAKWFNYGDEVPPPKGFDGPLTSLK